METGKFRKRVQIWRRAPQTLQGFNESKEVATYEADWWVEIVNLPGAAEVNYGGQIQAENLFSISMRYYATLGPTHEIHYGTRVFNVINASHGEESTHYSTAMCREVT